MKVGGASGPLYGTLALALAKELPADPSRDQLLLVTTADMAVDVYRAASGEFLRTLDIGAGTPFLVYGAQ